MARNKRVAVGEPMYKYSGHNYLNGEPFPFGASLPEDMAEILRERLSRVVSQFISQPGNEKDRDAVLALGIPANKGKGA